MIVIVRRTCYRGGQCARRRPCRTSRAREARCSRWGIATTASLLPLTRVLGTRSPPAVRRRHPNRSRDADDCTEPRARRARERSSAISSSLPAVQRVRSIAQGIPQLGTASKNQQPAHLTFPRCRLGHVRDERGRYWRSSAGCALWATCVDVLASSQPALACSARNSRTTGVIKW